MSPSSNHSVLVAAAEHRDEARLTRQRRKRGGSAEESKARLLGLQNVPYRVPNSEYSFLNYRGIVVHLLLLIVPLNCSDNVLRY